MMWRMICGLAEPPSFINTLPTVTKIAESQTAVLICQVFGAPKPVITWKKDEHAVIMDGRFRQENNGNLHISVSSYCTVLAFLIFLAFRLYNFFNAFLHLLTETTLTFIYGLQFLAHSMR